MDLEREQLGRRLGVGMSDAQDLQRVAIDIEVHDTVRRRRQLKLLQHTPARQVDDADGIMVGHDAVDVLIICLDFLQKRLRDVEAAVLCSRVRDAAEVRVGACGQREDSCRRISDEQDLLGHGRGHFEDVDVAIPIHDKDLAVGCSKARRNSG